MAREVSIGNQEFDYAIENNTFYIDKTRFIELWWNKKDTVTLITRPRRFGKTLMLSTVKCFFSNRYEGRKDLFEGLYISRCPEMMKLQGAYPVIALSFSDCKNIKESSGERTEYQVMVSQLKNQMSKLFDGFRYAFTEENKELSDDEREKCNIIRNNITDKYTDEIFSESIQVLCRVLLKFHGVLPIILLDEYDTPLQEADVNGYWKDLIVLMRSLFNTSFKTPDFYYRVLITGITRLSKESLFSDVNNFNPISVTSDEYSDCFGFTEQEMLAALEEYSMLDLRQDVKDWYDGFVFGRQKEIYNPYSIACLLDKKVFDTYWSDTSSNALVSRLIRHGADSTRDAFLKLMKGETINCTINENVVFADLETDANAVWSLLLGSGYLKAEEVMRRDKDNRLLKKPIYTLSITNLETRIMLKRLVNRWFRTGSDSTSYKEFIGALYGYDIKMMNLWLNKTSSQSFSYFDTANKTPEAFWQGFIIGLAVTLEADYIVTSNRIAGYGRYDVQLKPRDKSLQAFVIEFKSIDTETKKRVKEETQLARGVKEALSQIEVNKYYTELVTEGYPLIRKLGLAFKGQLCMIGDEEYIKPMLRTRKKT